MKMDMESKKDAEFENIIIGGNVLSNYILAVEKGFYKVLEKDTLSENLISGMHMVLQDGTFHTIDSSELAFWLAAISMF